MTTTPIAATPTWTFTPDASLQINSVAISADGNCCVFGTSNEFSTGQFSVYCYDGAGNKRWANQVGAAGSTQGVFWVAASADGQFAAAGGETSKTSGFLTAYRVSDGKQVLNQTMPYRINQVALSGDGSLLLAVYDDTVQLYNYTDGAYVLASQKSFTGSYLNSCALSPDGFTAVLSCTIYSDDEVAASAAKASARTAASYSSSTGQVISLTISGTQLSVAGTWDSPVGSMRVAIAATGNFWGASLHDGSCALFAPGSVNAPVWQYKPDVQNLSVGYGFDITETTDGRVVLACGANLHSTAGSPGGYLYLVESVPGTIVPVAKFCWGAPLALSANPGVSLDRNASTVTATDGAPGSETPGQVSESTGNFYLFDAILGTQLWSVPTPVMNWPMVITPDGTHAFGGSDDGSVYYWGAAAS